MIPLRDNVPSVHFSYAVWTVIVLNAAMFLFELRLAPNQLNQLLHFYGLVPARFTEPLWAAHAGYPADTWVPWLSYMFLHSGWWHIILNMWMLWIFADNIEDVTGPVRFWLFYLCCGLAAAALEVVSHPASPVPVVGASGAIAGVMGGYMMLYPHSRIQTLIPIFIIPFFVKLPAGLFLGIWFVIQVVSGMASAGQSSAGVAWWAHIGGFVAGMALIHLFVRRDRCYYCWNPDRKDYDLLDE